MTFSSALVANADVNNTTTATTPISEASGNSNASIYVAPARFDVHVANHFAEHAAAAFAAGNHLRIDLRMVDFVDEHIIAALDDIAGYAHQHNLTCTITEMSSAAALTFDLLTRAAA